MISCVRGSAFCLNRLKGRAGGRLLFRGLRERMGFGKLKFFVSGGAALPPHVQKGLEEFGFTVIQGYGLSEASPVLTLNPPEQSRLGSIGLPIPEVEIRITDPDPHGVGEIAARGGNIMSGYFKNEEATRETVLSDGFLLTGDMGYQDRDGFIHITGRKRSIIVTRGGENIYPEEVEALMLQSPFIEEILVLRGHNERTDQEEVQAMIYPDFEAMKACFLKEGGKELNGEVVREILAKEIEERGRRLGGYKRIRHFTVRNEPFPKTSTQKIKRYLFENQNLLRT
jgi:long-chain acyl-CoA synthetase